MQMARLRPAASRAAGLMRALGNSRRLLLLCELAQRELCVTELAERTGIGQPTLSQQLAVLRAGRFVATRRVGKQIFYSIADPMVRGMLKAVYRLYCGSR